MALHLDNRKPFIPNSSTCRHSRILFPSKVGAFFFDNSLFILDKRIV